MRNYCTVMLFGLLVACGSGTTSTSAPETATSPSSPQTTALPSGAITELTMVDTLVGDGASAQAGMTAAVHYTGWLYDEQAEDRRGTRFDSSLDRGQPFAFLIGTGQVIRGWDEGVAGMNVGGKRLLFLPPEYGYGARGAGNVIPPNATLTFEVELLELR